jgi:D-xylose transport system substrate-binding protein
MSVKSLLVVASLALSVLIGVVLGRSGADTDAVAQATRPVRIGLSLDTLKEARWTRDRDAFVEHARSLGADVTVLSANSDDNRQVADVETLVTAQMDVIVIVPHDGRAMARGVEIAHRAGIPVISYDRLILDSEPDLYITFDNERVGELQARYILEALRDAPRPIRLVRIYGSRTDNNAALFKAGQDKGLREAIDKGEVQVLHEDWADDWKPENAKRIMNAAITRHGRNIHAVLASNDGTAGGAIQALREEGLAGRVVVTGQDAELVAVQRIVAGEQAMTIYKPVQQLARRAAEAAVALARGKPIIARAAIDNGRTEVPTVLLDVVTVTRGNVEDTVVADGFHAREDIFQGRQ